MNSRIGIMPGMPAALVLASLLAAHAVADGEACNRCDSHCKVRKVCRPVCTTRTETITYWDCVAEDICLPGKSKCGRCADCGDGEDGGACDPSDCSDADVGDSLYRRLRHAARSKVRTRRRLIQKSYTREVPAIRWVVEYLCDGCAGSCDAGADARGESVLPTAPPIPSPPADDALLPSPSTILSPPAAPKPMGNSPPLAGRQETPPLVDPVRPAGHIEPDTSPVEHAIRALADFFKN